MKSCMVSLSPAEKNEDYLIKTIKFREFLQKRETKFKVL